MACRTIITGVRSPLVPADAVPDFERGPPFLLAEPLPVCPACAMSWRMFAFIAAAFMANGAALTLIALSLTGLI